VGSGVLKFDNPFLPFL